MDKTMNITSFKTDSSINDSDMDVISKFWDSFPKDLKRRLDYGRKVNGDYSVHKGGYKVLRESGKIVKNHIPENLRNLFVQMFITSDLDYFDKFYKDSKKYNSNRHDWINR